MRTIPRAFKFWHCMDNIYHSTFWKFISNHNSSSTSFTSSTIIKIRYLFDIFIGLNNLHKILQTKVLFKMNRTFDYFQSFSIVNLESKSTFDKLISGNFNLINLQRSDRNLFRKIIKLRFRVNKVLKIFFLLGCMLINNIKILFLFKRT